MTNELKQKLLETLNKVRDELLQNGTVPSRTGRVSVNMSAHVWDEFCDLIDDIAALPAQTLERPDDTRERIYEKVQKHSELRKKCRESGVTSNEQFHAGCMQMALQIYEEFPYLCNTSPAQAVRRTSALAERHVNGVCIDAGHRRHLEKTGEECTCTKYFPGQPAQVARVPDNVLAAIQKLDDEPAAEVEDYHRPGSTINYYADADAVQTIKEYLDSLNAAPAPAEKAGVNVNALQAQCESLQNELSRLVHASQDATIADTYFEIANILGTEPGGSVIERAQEVVDKLERVYAAGRKGIAHVARANYREREEEAYDNLRTAMYGVRGYEET